MKNTILSFSLNVKNMFLRRMDMFGSPVITSIKKMARKFNKNELPSIIISLYKTYGKNNIKDIKPIKYK